MEPRISIVIPVYNTARFIADALHSVFRQGYSNLEVIVVNDGSTDNTLEVLSQFGDQIHVVTQENKGQAAARNVGLSMVTGSIIGFIDADDVWPDSHIATMLPYLVSDSYDFVRGLTQYVRDLGTPGETMTERLFMEALVGACLYKKTVFDTVGLFDETMRQGEDFDWNIRLMESGLREKRLDETMLLYRRHDANLTNSKEFMEKGQIQAFRNKLARARSKK